MDTGKKSGYATDDDKEWGTGKYQHISDEDTDDEDTDDEDDRRREASVAVTTSKSRKDLDDLLQKIKLNVAKYILKDYTLDHTDDAIWEKVREEGTKHYKAEMAEFKNKERDINNLREKHLRTYTDEEQLRHLENRLHHEEKRLRRGSFLQNMEERMADINQLFNDGDDKIALRYAKWVNAMLNQTLHGRDMRDYKGGKRKRRTRKVRYRRKRRKRKTRRHKRTRRARLGPSRRK